MPAPLLATKLFLPSPRPGLVPRPRLLERLDAAVAGKLVLVSAPAGFGKTTLLAEWLAGWLAQRPAAGPAAVTGARSAAWLSLDRGDNDPATFWTYLIAALRTVAPGVGAGETALLADPRPPPIHLVLTTLLNDLGATGSDLVLVLDDFHLVESREIHDAMAFLLDHMPPRLHVVLAARADPAMPLARLRARGDLVELRAADMRFTLQEAGAYLDGVLGGRLRPDDVSALEVRTEGWIAALQLAALSMQGKDDVSGFIEGFAGDDRYIVDYLAEEVLLRQPPEVRDFLLQTSLLGRLNGALCDAVTGRAGGRAMLENLERGNLFVVPLDDRRQSYRYHHLFADVLRARLDDESPELVRVLHRRASDWYAENGEPSEAIAHAIAGEHVERAADLVELAMPSARRERQEVMLRGWLERLPEDLVAARPVLSNGYAGVLLSTGDVVRVEKHLRDAERGLRGDRARFVDEGEFHRLPAAVAIHRAGLALVTGDPSATVRHAERALDLLSKDRDALREDDGDLGRAAASALIGLASWWTGDVETAHTAYLTSLISMRRAGHLADVLGLSIALADLQITQGRLGEAARTYERALQLAPEHGVPVLRGTADMYVGLSSLRLERDDLPGARRFLARSEELGEQLGLPQNPYRRLVAMARVQLAEGDPDGAAGLLDEAEKVYVGDFSPNVRPVPALRARVWIRQGKLAEAFDWVRERGLSGRGELSYLQEYEHVTLARALLARHSTGAAGDALGQATELLDRLRAAAESGFRTGSLIEILVVQALAHQLRDDLPAASASLERALVLAEPERYVRIFVDEGPELAPLLATALRRGITPGFVPGLLAAVHPAAAPTSPQQAALTVGPAPAGQGLVDPLSRRELDVLRLLRSELGGADIARELVVSLNTVRTHTKNIYAKLGVNNRRAAVRRAKELGL